MQKNCYILLKHKKHQLDQIEMLCNVEHCVYDVTRIPCDNFDCSTNCGKRKRFILCGSL